MIHPDPTASAVNVKKSAGRVMVIDDEPTMGRILTKSLLRAGFEVTAYEHPRIALESINAFQPDVILSDMQMPEMSGLDVIKYVRKEHSHIPVLIATGYGTIEGAVDAMVAGAFNYFTKPFELNALLSLLERAIEHHRMSVENNRLHEALELTFDRHDERREMIGQGPAFLKLKQLIERAAPTDSSVLVTGKSGVGKELAARAIHDQSRRAHKRFVAINCPSISPTLIESEMFGHERGAFTGADKSKMGLIELADGGTLFLDEIAELPLEIQVKLLRVLQEREIQRVGGLKIIPIDLRVIAATNRDLKDEIKAKRFREDLFYRLNVIHLEIPPLSERRDDIPLLAQNIVDKLRRRLYVPSLHIHPDAINVLIQHHWPGNIRELENVLERAAVLADSDEIGLDDLPADMLGSTIPGSTALSAPLLKEYPSASSIEMLTVSWPVEYREARDLFDRQYLEGLLIQSGNNITKAAAISGMSRRNLYEKLEKLGISTRN